MDLSSHLIDIGLKKTEVRAYLYILENGLSSPPVIARGTKIQRPNIYTILQGLLENGLIEEQTKGKRKLYLARDPESILLNLQKKKDAIQSILPDLRGLYKAQKNKPTIKYYYGLDEIKNLFSQTDGAKEILFIISSNKLFETFPKHFASYRKRLVQEQVIVRDILTQKSGVQISKETKEKMKGYYDFRLFAKKYDDLPTSIRIWNNNIALANLDEPAFATLIINDHLAQTFRTMFETMWDSGTQLY